jgi:hypothetical protein
LWPSRTNSENVKQKRRYDEHGNFDEDGRYDRSGNYVYTWAERRLALVIAVTLMTLWHFFGSNIDKLPYSGVVEGIWGFVGLCALWVAVIGRAHPDPD